MYDIVVIGAGPAGYEVAALLGKGGKSVCIIDKSENAVGGTCLNEGCVPAKNFLETASFLKKSQYFKACGIELELKSFNIKQLKDKTSSLIQELRAGIISKLKNAKVEIKYGEVSFVDENSVKILNETNEIISAQKIIIATGSGYKEHPLIKLDKQNIISSKEVFELKKIPKSILIIGGGAIGCEMGTFFNSLGCEVEIAEFMPKLVPSEDDDIARTLKREMEREGIGVSLNANITSYEILEDCIEVNIDIGKDQKINRYEKVLISIGRVPNSSNLNLSLANVEQNNGFVKVDSNLRSISNKNIYAIGDVIDTPALAHMAYYEAKRASQNILQKEVMDEKTIFPNVIFCSPQVATIGQNERQLKENGINFKVKKVFFKANPKAKIKGDDRGFVKVIYDENSGKIYGAAIIGNDATETIHQFLIAINGNLNLDDLSKMIFAHPTLSETISDLTNI